MTQPVKDIQASVSAQVIMRDQEDNRKCPQLFLSQELKDQQTSETHNIYTVSCTNKPSSVSVTLLHPTHTLQTLLSSMRLASVCVLPQHKHPISPTLRKQYETALHQWKCFGSFLRSPDKCSYKLYREPIYVCCYQRILHHLYFKVLPLAEQPLYCGDFSEMFTQNLT